MLSAVFELFPVCELISFSLINLSSLICVNTTPCLGS